jgi:uncharacterized membrane protein
MRKTARVIAGFLLLIAGLVLAVPGIPGPGLAVMLVGLILLAEHFHWARRAVDWLKLQRERLRSKKS